MPYQQGTGGRVTVRMLLRKDMQDYLAAFSEHVRRALHDVCHESERAYVLDRIAKMQCGKTFFYGIFDTIDYHLIGAIEIRNADEAAGQLYCWLHENYWGKGYFQEAVSLVASDYFKHNQVRFFSAHVDIDNKRSYCALKKCGFAEAGFCDGPHGKQYALVLRRK